MGYPGDCRNSQKFGPTWWCKTSKEECQGGCEKEELRSGYQAAQTNNSTMDVIAEFDKVVHCLALDLPEQVWKDVNNKWKNVRQLHQ